VISTVETTNDIPAIPEDAIVLGAVETPMGAFGAVFTARGLACLSFPSDALSGCEAWVRRHAPDAHVIRDHPALAALSAQLTAYFEGSLHAFTIPLDLRGTPFQREVWQALLSIPYGEVRSYATIAAAIGRPRAVRAVGMANHDNPVPIVVPCHRVIGRNGSLTGYGGGLPLKERLLQREGVLLGQKSA
jgi:O-6-methylguanine DNA methyltransferase